MRVRPYEPFRSTNGLSRSAINRFLAAISKYLLLLNSSSVLNPSELYMDFLDHRFYRRHDFRDVKFFSGKVHQTIAEPKE
jgi:hypothetical protein